MNVKQKQKDQVHDVYSRMNNSETKATLGTRHKTKINKTIKNNTEN